VLLPHGGGLILELSEEVVRDARQGWCARRRRGAWFRDLAHHGDLELGHDFAPPSRPRHGGAERLWLGGGVDMAFMKPRDFGRLQGAGDVFMGILRRRMARFCLRASASRGRAAELRINERRCRERGDLWWTPVPFSRGWCEGCGNRRRKDWVGCE